ncbi:MAG: MBL fold metallo-hydrolase [Spirochaetales bacterium]|nr:MBL fold metallo-hydrolase [Spirochaetales bacterium]
MNIATIHCKNVKCYLLPSSEGWFLFDAAWPHQYSLFRDSVKALGIRMKDIKRFVVSHFHIDHAGLAGMFMANGMEFTVFENQTAHLDEMEALIERKGYPYTKIKKPSLQNMNLSESRAWLRSLGIEGVIIQIFGHGDHSIALVLDSGDVLIGDLPVEYHYDDLVKADWDRLYSLGGRTFFPAHAEGFSLD